MSASNGRKYVLRIQQKLTHIIIHTSLRHGYSFRQQKLRLTLQIRTTTRVSLFLRVCVCVRVCARLQSGPERIAQSLMHHHFTTICSRITRFSPKMLLMYVDVDYPHPHPQKTRRFCINLRNGLWQKWGGPWRRPCSLSLCMAANKGNYLKTVNNGDIFILS